MKQSRYIVGIDLGTTNSVVAWIDTSAPECAPQALPIPQVTVPGTVEERSVLPSFLYVPADAEFPAGALALPWPQDGTVVAGEFARKRGAEVPSRLVASAKSWLSYGGADRTAAILPWEAPSDVAKLSPVDASACYLRHLCGAWHHRFPEAPLPEQEVLLTVPASFDAAARELTVEAAQRAGLSHVTLLEEPQAAFYAWIDACGERWREAVGVGDLVLVCDIGGGTTDFTLIAVREERGELQLERVAVGDHILLGGDNMDLALAFGVRERLAQSGTPLDAWQFRGLTLACRDAKERVLGDASVAKHPVPILGRGRKVVGGTLRVDVSRADVEGVLLEGFFPQGAASDRPQAQRRSALQEIGLPYATDPAVTRHLAHFLGQHGGAVGAPSAQPTAVLFNGGVMAAPPLRARLAGVLNAWFGKEPSAAKKAVSGEAGVRILSGGNPEHAVARGAAYYGLARRGRGVRIRGGTPRSYYVGIEAAMPAVPGVRPPIRALCVVPQGLEEGSEVRLPEREFALVVGEPTEFRFLGSSSRRDDRVGDVVETWGDDIQELSPLAATLDRKGREGSTVPVRLEARVNEVGILELWCVARDGKGRWKLEFNVRSVTP